MKHGVAVSHHQAFADTVPLSVKNQDGAVVPSPTVVELQLLRLS